jgi:hypothetical protein
VKILEKFFLEEHFYLSMTNTVGAIQEGIALHFFRFRLYFSNEGFVGRLPEKI